MVKFLAVSLLAILVWIQSYFYGLNDVVIGIILLVTTILIFMTLRRLQINNRQLLKIYTDEKSFLRNLLDGKPSVPSMALIFLSSLILSFLFIALVKGVALKQGLTFLIIIISLTLLFMYRFINEQYVSDSLKNNVANQVLQSGNELARIFYAALLINLFISFAFSGYDTHKFIVSDINFSNVTDISLEQAVQRNDYNRYGRGFINAYIVLDNVKIVVAKIILEIVNMTDSFISIYFTIFLLNLFKYFAFSFAAVILLRSITQISERLALIFMKVFKRN